MKYLGITVSNLVVKLHRFRLVILLVKYNFVAIYMAYQKNVFSISVRNFVRYYPIGQLLDISEVSLNNKFTVVGGYN